MTERLGVSTKLQPLWTNSPCTIGYATQILPQQRIQRFSIVSIYQHDDPHKPKRVDEIGEPYYILRDFRKQIRQASRSGFD